MPKYCMSPFCLTGTTLLYTNTPYARAVDLIAMPAVAATALDAVAAIAAPP